MLLSLCFCVTTREGGLQQALLCVPKQSLKFTKASSETAFQSMPVVKVKPAHELLSAQAPSPTWLLELVTASRLHLQWSHSWCWCFRTINLIWTPNNSVLQEHAASTQSIMFVCWGTQCGTKNKALEDMSVALGLPADLWPFGTSPLSGLLAVIL